MMRGGEEVVFRYSFVDHEIAVAITRIRRENEKTRTPRVSADVRYWRSCRIFWSG